MGLEQLNFRDLGGIGTRSGIIRTGALFRAEGPANYAARHHSELIALGIRNIIDLRSSSERERHPHAWQGDDCRWLGLDVNADLRVFGNDGRERLSLGDDLQLAIDIMVETYREIPDALFGHWQRVGECLLEGAPALINCTAGKDRTGVAVAVLLEMLGASRDAIMADYKRSAVFGENLRSSGSLEAGFLASFGFMPSPAQVDALIGVRAEYLHAAWQEIESQYRSISHYLAEAGLGEKTQNELRRLFTTERVAAASDGEI